MPNNANSVKANHVCNSVEFIRECTKQISKLDTTKDKRDFATKKLERFVKEGKVRLMDSLDIEEWITKI